MQKDNLAIQEPSTRKNLERPIEEDEAWQNRPLPEDIRAVPNAKSVEEAVGERALTPYEIITYERYRRSSKNSEDQSTLSGISEAKKVSAINAFMATQGIRVSDEDLEKYVRFIAWAESLPEMTPEKVRNLFNDLMEKNGMAPEKVKVIHEI